MNSWTSTFEFACAPPLRIFMRGTGRDVVPEERCCQISPLPSAARRQAMDTPRIALAPKEPLFGVPSREIIDSSIACWLLTSMPTIAAAIGPLTFATACSTPLPAHAKPPSRNSTASWRPVLAPEGTAARPMNPPAVWQSTSTVGLPRESKIIRAWTRVMRVPIECPTSGGLLNIAQTNHHVFNHDNQRATAP